MWIRAALGFTLAFCWPARARGQIFVWPTAMPITPNAFVDAQTSPQDGIFTPLELRCDKSLGECSWRVSVQLQIFGGTSTAYRLWTRDPAGSGTLLTTSQTSISGSPYTNLVFLNQNGANGFIHDIAASPPAPLAGSRATQFMYSFVLSKSGQDFTGVTSLNMGTHCFSGIEPQDPGDPCRRVAMVSNIGILVAQGAAEWPGVIRISNVPEPGSLWLLACGFMLLRHRKRSRV